VLTAQRRRWLLPLAIGALVLLADQLSKLWVLHTLGPVPAARRIALVGDWLNLVYSRNTGVAFGLFQGMDVSEVFLVLALLISVGAIYAYIYHLPNHILSVQISTGLILGGALGNVFDRIRLGYVVDFIQVSWWPVFNLADSSITVGATILALFLLFGDDEPQQPAAEPVPEAQQPTSDEAAPPQG
jgi:signal peptidase II